MHWWQLTDGSLPWRWTSSCSAKNVSEVYSSPNIHSSFFIRGLCQNNLNGERWRRWERESLNASMMTEVRFLCKSPGTEKLLEGILGSPEGTRMSMEDSENWLFRAVLERALSSFWFSRWALKPISSSLLKSKAWITVSTNAVASTSDLAVLPLFNQAITLQMVVFWHGQ